MTNNEHYNICDSNTEYEVENIIDIRTIKKKDIKTNKTYYVKEYLVKWLGYDEQTWEPESNLDNCQEILNDFKKQLKKMQKTKKKLHLCKKSFWTNNTYSKNNNISKVAKSCIKIPKRKYKNLSIDNISYSCLNENIYNYELYNKEIDDESRTQTPIKHDNHSITTKNEKQKIIKNKKEVIEEDNNIKIYEDTGLNENIEQNNTQYSTNVKMPIFSNIHDKCTFSTESEFGPQFHDVINSGSLYNKKKKLKEEEKYTEKKRKREDSFSSFYFATDNLNNIDQIIDNNINFKQPNNNNKNIEFVEICEVKVPSKKNECINIYAKFKINGKIIDIHGKSELNTFPKEEIFKCYENILKYYFSGKKLIFK